MEEGQNVQRDSKQVSKTIQTVLKMAQAPDFSLSCSSWGSPHFYFEAQVAITEWWQPKYGSGGHLADELNTSALQLRASKILSKVRFGGGVRHLVWDVPNSLENENRLGSSLLQ